MLVGCQRLLFVLRSWPLATTLPAADVDHPESQKSLDGNRRPVCRVGGGGFSGAEFVPFPSPSCLLPPAGMGRLFSGVSQSLCCENGRPAVCSGRLIFSPAIPQFKRAPSDCSQGFQAGPYPKQCCPLLSVPLRLLVADAGIWGTFLLGVAFRHIICGPYFIFPPS